MVAERRWVVTAVLVCTSLLGCERAERPGPAKRPLVRRAAPAAPRAATAAGSTVAEADGGTTVVVAPDPRWKEQPRPWGSPVPAPAIEKQVMERFAAIARDGSGANQALADPFVAGPTMWTALRLSAEASHDQIIPTLGTPTIAVVDSYRFDMRAYSGDARVALLGTEVFQTIARRIAGGKVRPASELEREHYFRLIPFEIDGEPVTIVDFDGGHQAAVTLDGEHGALLWVDLLSEYHWDEL